MHSNEVIFYLAIINQINKEYTVTHHKVVESSYQIVAICVVHLESPIHNLHSDVGIVILSCRKWFQASGKLTKGDIAG